MASFVQSLATVISTPDGRDKAHALLEKPAKLMLYLMASGQLSVDQRERLTAFAHQIMMARGINRLFSSSSIMSGLCGLLASKDESPVKYAKMVIMVGWMGFFYFDNKIFLGLSGLMKNVDYPTAGKRASQLWLFCVFLTLVLHTMHFSALDKEDKGKDNRKVIKTTKMKIAAGCMELMCASRGSGLISFNDGWNEGLMLGSALIGIWRTLLQ